MVLLDQTSRKTGNKKEGKKTGNKKHKKQHTPVGDCLPATFPSGSMVFRVFVFSVFRYFRFPATFPSQSQVLRFFFVFEGLPKHETSRVIALETAFFLRFFQTPKKGKFTGNTSEFCELGFGGATIYIYIYICSGAGEADRRRELLRHQAHVDSAESQFVLTLPVIGGLVWWSGP